MHNLLKINDYFSTFNNVFNKYIHGDNIKHTHFVGNIQWLSAWGLKGKDGSSGAGSMGIYIMDAFLRLKGKGVMYHSSMEFRERLLENDRKLVESLELPDKKRFKNLEEPMGVLIKSLQKWRINHKARGINYLKQGKSIKISGIDVNKHIDVWDASDVRNTNAKVVSSLAAILQERIEETTVSKCPFSQIRRMSQQYQDGSESPFSQFQFEDVIDSDRKNTCPSKIESPFTQYSKYQLEEMINAERLSTCPNISSERMNTCPNVSKFDLTFDDTKITKCQTTQEELKSNYDIKMRGPIYGLFLIITMTIFKSLWV